LLVEAVEGLVDHGLQRGDLLVCQLSKGAFAPTFR
jgi:hypothetical protein